MLKRQGVIETFHDRCIPGGDALDHTISAESERANVILLLVSPDFPASAYCCDIEMQRAVEHHECGKARVIPVILRHYDWHDALFGRLRATPRYGKPVKAFPDLDEAFLQIAQHIRQARSAHLGHQPRKRLSRRQLFIPRHQCPISLDRAISGCFGHFPISTAPSFKAKSSTTSPSSSRTQ